jgi:hypothetical protein
VGITATIHQPDFMPWLGFFAKLSKVDEFIVLDHVVNNPRDANFWCRRVKMMLSGKADWFSIPLLKDSSRVFVPINEMRINIDTPNFARKNLETIRHSYSKAPHYKEVFPLIEAYFNHSSDGMLERNLSFINEVLKLLNINCKVLLSSSLNPSGSSNEMLIDLLKKRFAQKYVCGDGAAGYQNNELFNKESIEIEYNGFQHPRYKQFNSESFIPGLSVIDALMNLGFSETEYLVKLR